MDAIRVHPPSSELLITHRANLTLPSDQHSERVGAWAAALHAQGSRVIGIPATAVLICLPWKEHVNFHSSAELPTPKQPIATHPAT